MIRFIFVVCILLSGCSANWHLTRAIKKDPSIITRDTVTTVDTVWNVIESVDTLIQVKNRTDTVVFWKDSIYVKYHYNVRDSLIYLEVDCPDCPEVTKTNEVTKVVYREMKWYQKHSLKLIIPMLLLYFLIIPIIRRR